MLVELCAGMSALTLHLFGRKPPASRIGAKTGYAHAIARELGINEAPERAILIDSDPALCNALWWLYREPAQLAFEITALSSGPPREVWKACRERRGDLAAAWWLWTAGARGGIGGFKGAHVRRPNVDGFIPSRDQLAVRIAAFKPIPEVDIICQDAREVEPIRGATVYLDPPYLRTTCYGAVGMSWPDVFRAVGRWTREGCPVGVSERSAILHPGFKSRAIDITNERQGQSRRSLTTSTVEWLTVFEAA